jgi:hypothetical protein
MVRVLAPQRGAACQPLPQAACCAAVPAGGCCAAVASPELTRGLSELGSPVLLLLLLPGSAWAPAGRHHSSGEEKQTRRFCTAAADARTCLHVRAPIAVCVRCAGPALLPSPSCAHAAATQQLASSIKQQQL